MPTGFEAIEPVEQFFLRIIEDYTRQHLIRYSLRSETEESQSYGQLYRQSLDKSSEVFSEIAEHQNLIWRTYQQALKQINFTGCNTRWHQDILKMHVMSTLAITELPDDLICFNMEFQAYVESYLKLMDSYIEHIAKHDGIEQANMAHFYWRVIFHCNILYAWPSGEKNKLIKEMPTVFVDKEGKDEFGSWNKRDEENWTTYHLRLLKRANQFLETAYSECFPPEPRSPILLISQIEPASRIRAHTVCSASSEELKPDASPRVATAILASKKTTVEEISLGAARPRSEIIEEAPTACP